MKDEDLQFDRTAMFCTPSHARSRFGQKSLCTIRRQSEKLCRNGYSSNMFPICPIGVPILVGKIISTTAPAALMIVLR